MTKIEWTQRPGTKGETWNPIAAFDKETGKRGWFCEKVSAGCTHCYAEQFNRFRGNGHLYRVGNRDKIELHQPSLTRPLHWAQPRTVFVCSMTDLFFEGHTDEMIDNVFAVMALCAAYGRKHVFQVLTKRPQRMREYVSHPERRERIAVAAFHARGIEEESCYAANSLNGVLGEGRNCSWPMQNVWLGTSVENQGMANERIPQLLETPAAVRFLSCEPLLESVHLERIDIPTAGPGSSLPASVPAWLRYEPLKGFVGSVDHKLKCVGHNALRIDWVIVGGESGPGARPCDLDAVRSLVYQCKTNGVAVFVKQLGACPAIGKLEWDAHPMLLNARTRAKVDESTVPLKFGDPKGGNIEEWPMELRVREYPEVAA